MKRPDWLFGIFFLLCLWLLASGCAGTKRYPARECLCDNAQCTRFRTGTSLGQRADGTIIFRFDDPSQGDNGLYLFSAVESDGLSSDAHGRVLRPCIAAGGRSLGLEAGGVPSDPWGRQ